MHNLVAKFTPAVEADADDAGLTTVEYAVAGALIAAAVVGAFAALGTQVGDGDRQHQDGHRRLTRHLGEGFGPPPPGT